MELEFLGTGAGVPAKHRNVSSIALKLLDERNEIWLFDCGEGTQMQILRTNIRPRKIEKIFITHLHGDHIFGLPGLISSRSFQGGETPLEIYGPKGTEAFVRNALTISQTKLGYPLVFIDLSEDQAIFEDAHFSVYAKKLSHGIDSYGYRIVEHDHKGELQVDKLKELNIPAGPIYGKLKKGETVQLDNGQLINGCDFVGPDKKGRIVTILGDTRKTTNSVILAKNADVLVHESTFNKNEARMAHNYFHSTTHQAAEVAKEANVQRLLLTHISARYLGKATQELEQEAQEIFPNTKVMKDFEVVDVPFQEEEKKLNLENKVVLVTGGSGGLGAQICYEATKQGAIVVTCARRIQQIGEVMAVCQELSGKPAYAFQLDVSNPDSVDELYDKVMTEVGRVDILVNNAGFGIFEDFLSFDLGKAYDMFEVNVLGMMVLTQKFAIDMAERRQGHIINVASMAGKMATAKSTIYSATKFAVLGFSNALRLELKPLGVAVTTVNPGPIETEFFDKADPSGSYLEKVGHLVLDSTKLAQTIVRAMKHPKREINQPVLLEIASKFYALFPTIGDYFAGGIFNKK